MHYTTPSKRLFFITTLFLSFIFAWCGSQIPPQETQPQQTQIKKTNNFVYWTGKRDSETINIFWLVWKKIVDIEKEFNTKSKEDWTLVYQNIQYKYNIEPHVSKRDDGWLFYRDSNSQIKTSFEDRRATFVAITIKDTNYQCKVNEIGDTSKHKEIFQKIWINSNNLWDSKLLGDYWMIYKNNKWLPSWLMITIECREDWWPYQVTIGLDWYNIYWDRIKDISQINM
jgi:hypothetical protein